MWWLGGTLAVLCSAVVALLLLERRQKAHERRRYQRFLQEDKETSTLEYVENVTQQRRDSRMWR